MRNYIILNNQNSNTISGLIIQELAPISKPLQRTQVETIDGRDGDIVTPLGYAAYNKKIKIGLYGNFDINEVIAYFATKGTVIFSNEPDKYYYYQIVDQIDYERLVRYRVATVTMHVQPFKYSATEGTITVDASDTVSGDGSDIALDDTAEAPFNVLRHKGNATQDGTPTPDNPIEIKVLTGDSTVKITGKNLQPTTWAQDFVNAVNTSNLASLETFDGKNCLSYQPSAGYNSYPTKNFTLGAKFKENTQYTISFDEHSTTSNRHVAFYYTDGTYSYGAYTSADTWNHIVLTSTAGKTVAYVAPFYTSGTTHIDINTFQLEEGTQASQFEPYQGQSYTINLGATELAKIGDYADEPVKVDGTWYIRRAIDKKVFTGAAGEAWGTVGNLSGTPNWMYYIYTPKAGAVTGGINALCNIGSWTNISSDNTNQGIMLVNNSLLRVRLGEEKTIADWKTWLNTHNMVLYYILATPTDEAITDQDLIDALDDFINQAHAYKGHTHITATAEDGNAPAVLAVDVNEDNESTVTNAGNTTSRPILTVYGQGDIGVYINDVEVLDIALGDEEYITLDSVEMEAYKDTTANLKNRLVTGDYSKLALNAGANKIRFTGKVTKYEISKYSRWL